MNNFCRRCKKFKTCTKLCKEVESFMDQDYTPRKERLECEIEKEVEQIIETEYPEGEIELSTKDWIYLIKNTELTKLQRKYLYLYYWKRLSYYQIGRKYKVSKQGVTAVVKRAKNKAIISLGCHFTKVEGLLP